MRLDANKVAPTTHDQLTDGDLAGLQHRFHGCRRRNHARSITLFSWASQSSTEIFDRVRERSLPYWADPAQSQPGEINHHDGGRDFYFEDPDRHFLEIITRPYGSGAEKRVGGVPVG
jgi:hypothetical protein